jgi:hypothetical protein
MRLILIGAAVLGAAAGPALAQYYGPYAEYHASTAAEGAARGMADVVRSQGQANLANSAAAINMTEAQSNYIQNRDQWTNTYFQMRDANRKYRAAERGPRPSMEDLVRNAQTGMPDRLSPGELDSVAGGISWPGLLQTDQYAAYRSELDALYAKRARDGALSTPDYIQADKLTKDMMAELKDQIRDVPQMDYIAAKRFLQSLGYEARLPAG